MEWAEYPDVLVEIELEPDVWTDFSPQLKTFQKTGGRSRERQRPEAGRATVVFDGLDRSLEPENTAGEHFPLVRLMRRIRITALTFDPGPDPFIMGSSLVGGPDVLGGGSSPSVTLFTYYIESVDVDWPSNGFDAEVTITAVDAFKILSLIQLNFGSGATVYSTGALINLVLDAVGWPETERAIDPGTVAVIDLNTTGSALEYILQIAESEDGLFFHAPDGKLTFYDRNHLSPDELVFATDEVLFADVDVSYDDSELWNDVTVTTDGQAPQIAEDPRSIGTIEAPRYFRRPLSVTSMIWGPNRAAERAQEILITTREPRQRAGQLVHVGAQPAWAPILQAMFLDPVTVEVDPPGGGPTVVQPGRIEGITLSSTRRRNWQVSWQMSPPPRTNLLTRGQSNADGWAGGVEWTADQAFCDVTVSNPPFDNAAYNGTLTWKLMNTDAVARDISISSSPNTQIPVTPGQRYVLSAFLALLPGASGTWPAHLELAWRDGAGVEVSSTAGAPGTLDNNPTWNGVWVEGTAPVGAAFVTARIAFSGATATTGGGYADMVILTLDQ